MGCGEGGVAEGAEQGGTTCRDARILFLSEAAAGSNLAKPFA